MGWTTPEVVPKCVHGCGCFWMCSALTETLPLSVAFFRCFCFTNLLGQLSCGRQNKSLAFPQIEIELLEDGDSKGGGFAGTRLGLRNNVQTWKTTRKQGAMVQCNKNGGHNANPKRWDQNGTLYNNDSSTSADKLMTSSTLVLSYTRHLQCTQCTSSPLQQGMIALCWMAEGFSKLAWTRDLKEARQLVIYKNTSNVKKHCTRANIDSSEASGKVVVTHPYA